MESWVVESAGSVLWGQIPGAAAVQGGKLQTQEKQQLVVFFFWLSTFFLVIFWTKGLQVEWFGWNGDLAERAGRTGWGARFERICLSFLAGLMTTGLQCLLCFLFGGTDSCAGFGAGSWVSVESRSDVLPFPPSLLHLHWWEMHWNVWFQWETEALGVHTFTKMPEFSLLLKWECPNKKWHILIMRWGGRGKEGVESNPTSQDLGWHHFLYNCNASRHSINISALLTWFMSQIVEYKILSIDVSSLIFPGASSWRMEVGGDFNKQSLTGIQRKQCAGTDSWQIQYGAIKTCDEFAGKVYICGRGELISTINLSAVTQCSQAWHE